MDTATLVIQAKKIINRYQNDSGAKLYAKAREFLRVHAGEKSTFFEMLDKLQNSEMYGSERVKAVYDQVEAFIEYLESGFFQSMSLEQKVKTDTILDLLDRAGAMLKDVHVHPAGPAVLIGSVLEESLRIRIEERGLKPDKKRKNIGGYAMVLEKEKILSKQDAADILHWNVLYTYALKGEWEEVNDRKRITIMHEGVLLFMRKYITS